MPPFPVPPEGWPSRPHRPGTRRRSPVQETIALLAGRPRPMGRTERRSIVQSLFHEGPRRGPFLHRFHSLMVLSVAIAVLGLLANSTAVVIGAMLVAPLMGPTLAVAAALVMDWRRRVATSAMTVLVGSALAVGLSALMSFLLPGDPEQLSEELLARTSPTLLDLAVALLAGAAGAYAKLRRQAADAIVGVAVAVALIPPLAVLGITLELGRYQMAMGALLLFLANVSGIVTAAAATLLLLGFVPSTRLRSKRARVAQSLRLAVLGTVAVVAPLQVVDQWRPQPTLDSNPEELVAEAVDAWRSDVTIIAFAMTRTDPDRPPVLELTVASDNGIDSPLGADRLAEDLATIVGEPVEVVLTAVESNVESAVGEGDGKGDAEGNGEE